MSQSIEDILSQSFQGYDVNAFRSLFEQQTEYNAESYSLNSTDMGFDSPVLNSSFVHFMFLGKYGQYIINEADWEFGMAGKEFLGLKLLEDMRKEVSCIGPISNKQQIQWRMNNVVRRWLPLLDGLTEEEQIEFESLVYSNFKFLIRSHIEALPDYEHTKVKLRCNGNEAVFLFLCLCEDFWLPNTTENNAEVNRLIAKLEETFQFKHQRDKTPTDLGRFRATIRKFRNGELSNIDDLIDTYKNFFEEGKHKFTK